MKRILYLFLAIMLVSACGPSRYVMHIDMRYPSKTGVDLWGKIPAVVYFESNDAAVSTFSNGVAGAFANALEQDLGMDEGSVGVYKMFKQSDASYTSRDSLLTLLIDTGADVLFLFDQLELTDREIANNSEMVSFTMKLCCFDGMDKTESVKTFAGSSTARADGLDAGRMIAESFKSKWKTEAYSLTYYDSEKWLSALQKAEAYDWKGAMDLWFELLQTNDFARRSSAAFNIAVACYMLGDYSLASQWLDRSDADNKLPNMSESLRTRIDKRRD